MFCPKCGKELDNGAAFCGYCGASIKPQTEYGTYTQQQAAPAYTSAAPVIDRGTVSKKEFIEKYAPQNLRKNINSMAIVCYICCAISVGASLFILKNPYGLLDVAILLGLTLGMHLGKSKICAIILLIVSILECIMTSIMLGTLSGWWWIVASASAVSTFIKLDKQYNLFLLGSTPVATAPVSSQPFVPGAESVQAPAQTDVYYTPSQPAEPEAAPEPIETAPEPIAETEENQG